MNNTTRILVYSDLQAHQWQESERPTRINDYLAVIRKMRIACTTYQADALVFCGDLFEAKRAVRNDIASRIYTALLKPLFVRNGPDRGQGSRRIPQYFLSGNHDYHKGICTLQPLASTSEKRYVFVAGGRISDSGKANPNAFELKINDIRCLFMPHGVSTTAIAANTVYDIMFSHHTVEGGQHKPTIVDKYFEGLTIDLYKRGEGRLLVVNGHYHGHQVIHKRGFVPIVCVGSPLQHNWTDADAILPRGFLDICVTNVAGKKKLSYTHREFNSFPKFYKEQKGKARDIDFVSTIDTSSALAKSSTMQHARAGQVSSGVSGSSLAAYMVNTGMESTDPMFTRFLKVGLRLTKGVVTDEK